MLFCAKFPLNFHFFFPPLQVHKWLGLLLYSGNEVYFQSLWLLHKLNSLIFCPLACLLYKRTLYWSMRKWPLSMCVIKWGQEGLCLVETEIISYSQHWLGTGETQNHRPFVNGVGGHFLSSISRINLSKFYRPSKPVFSCIWVSQVCELLCNDSSAVSGQKWA